MDDNQPTLYLNSSKHYNTAKGLATKNPLNRINKRDKITKYSQQMIHPEQINKLQIRFCR
jgi:hypothetical protein